MQPCKSRLYLFQRASFPKIPVSDCQVSSRLLAPQTVRAQSTLRIHRHSQSLAVTHDVPGVYLESGKSKPPWIRPKGCGTGSAWFARQTFGVCDYWVDKLILPSSALAPLSPTHSPYEAGFRQGPPSTVTSPAARCSRFSPLPWDAQCYLAS
jgi:hypothetical protein